jgi:UDP-3-O-[3-hydroxymyristoyl] N-acetylglucosamine deacetylase
MPGGWVRVAPKLKKPVQKRVDGVNSYITVLSAGHKEISVRMNQFNVQKTIARPVSCSGVGVHSGKQVNLTVQPAPLSHGIKFRRVDLPDCPSVAARFSNVVDTSLATVIGNDGFIVSTIEHLMAAFAGLGIDNAVVDVDAHELPIMDGSAGPFAEMLIKAGIVGQKGPRCYFIIKKPIELEADGKFVGIYPAAHFQISCTIEFDHPLIRTQTHSAIITADYFLKEIAGARTFGFYHEVELMKKYGLGQGASLDNAVVIDREGVLNEGGLRFEDEFVRHKLLDCIGDFSLLGLPIQGHIVAKKSGHNFHHTFLEKFFREKDSWQTCTSNDVTPKASPGHRKQLAN